MEKEFNPLIKVVQSLRKLAVEINSTNLVIHTSDHQIRLNIGECGELIASTNNGMVINLWSREKAQLLENSDTLLKILENIEEKFQKKETTDLLESWEVHSYYKEWVLNSIHRLKTIGDTLFVGENLQVWDYIWKDILKSLHTILSIAETYKLKLKMIKALEPEQVDALTLDIIKYIPFHYSDKEADEYEKEYLWAYHELKESQSKKKNSWDKVMDVLAGGVEETPAHRVQMRRWMEGA